MAKILGFTRMIRARMRQKRKKKIVVKQNFIKSEITSNTKAHDRIKTKNIVSELKICVKILLSLTIIYAHTGILGPCQP